MAKKSVVTEKEESKDTRAELKELLKRRLPACFEKEPAPAFTSELDKLVEEIISTI